MKKSESMLDNHVQCEHRVTTDRYGPTERHDEIEMLFAEPLSIDLYTKVIRPFWYDQFARSGDPVIQVRIVECNENDCRANAVLSDSIRRLPVRII